MGKDLKGREIGQGIVQRKDGRYVGRYTDNAGNRKSIYSTKLSEVKRQLNDVNYEVAHGLYSKNPVITVDQWFDEWITTYKKGKVKDSTLESYRYPYQHISKAIGFMRLTDVKMIHLQKIINDLADRGYAYSTLTLTRVCMHALFDQAVLNEYISKNPSKGVKLPTDDTGERRVLTVDEQELFLKYLPGTEHELEFRFVLLTGLRASEISGLIWDNVNFERKELYITQAMGYSKKENKFFITTPKTKSSIRTIPLVDEALQILKDQRKKQMLARMKSANWNTEESFKNLVFTSQNGRPNGHAIYNNAIKSILRRMNRDIVAEAKMNGTESRTIPGFSMHTLRHSFATRAFESGMKPKVVQQILGHATLNVTTDLYMHTTIEHLHREIEKFVVVKGA